MDASPLPSEHRAACYRKESFSLEKLCEVRRQNYSRAFAKVPANKVDEKGMGSGGNHLGQWF